MDPIFLASTMFRHFIKIIVFEIKTAFVFIQTDEVTVSRLSIKTGNVAIANICQSIPMTKADLETSPPSQSRVRQRT